MRIPIPVPALARRAACAMALTAAACDGGTGPDSATSIIDFDALANGEQVSAQYGAAAGVQFVGSTLECGVVCSVPPGEAWRMPCESLPTVTAYAAAPSGGQVASIRSGTGEFTMNAVCARLDRPASLVRIRVRNELGADSVTLVAVGAAGQELRSARSALSPMGFTMLWITTGRDDIAGFTLVGARSAHLLIDDVWITRPR